MMASEIMPTMAVNISPNQINKKAKTQNKMMSCAVERSLDSACEFVSDMVKLILSMKYVPIYEKI